MPILDSPSLRRIAAPLRRGAPRIYHALNAVRGRLIRGTSPVTPYQALALRHFRDRCLRSNPGSLDILELGSDLGLLVLDELVRMGARSVQGVNPSASLWTERSETEIFSTRGARLVKGDARRLELPDSSFDRVFSVAAFEHILELPLALREMHRVLRPGGLVFAAFGPIWSGCKGHHLNVEVNGQRFDHGDAQLNPLPDFSHLLLHPDELRDAMARTHGASVADAVVEWIWRSPELNRMFFHEYERSFRESPFELLSLISVVDPVPRELEQLLRLRYPEESRFDVTGGEVILRRRA
jgi:SAM-dependent methyltransferase